ncbi:hypothetical protein F441_13052 [Phytophthora nicotianae CJ01A1]|uniref:Uncharacterized protein n=5 Tax=Phytophthora nicotianae TaxID=4792 RepID=W2R485_PHYN3|nr:hypothetical protein PPTG_21219 [Phytophthora nicotianae INRA-310]ETI41687.1 hypothetical protein F443_13091 [Phytophthora nicotianae P1569]ETL88363.1 hypothetical protein L917_12543 [Phytophthora nicotianae]ETO70310.1 hypothetical protein F444_13186 [Phytophthora nicotianae P1976]ETP11419.1 hypothetical protein F441_13052 [Phytophthora nicotianae CJ01A1]ETM41611.1 hypothetical protein L914_12621 [Phytophthora nicotianae]
MNQLVPASAESKVLYKSSSPAHPNKFSQTLLKVTTEQRPLTVPLVG